MSPDYEPDFSECLLPYVQWYQDDFVGGVRGMRAHEIGIYTMLLMEMYARGRALDLSEDRLARLCGTDRRTFSKVLDMLIADGKIIRLNCGLWNDRCENAFRERAKMQEQRKTAAQASWEKRNKNSTPPERPHSERSAVAMLSSEAQIYSDTSVSGAKVAPDDPKARLFNELLASVMRQTGKSREPAAKLIGKWRKACGDDDAKILDKLRQAEERQVADVVSWVTKALQEQSMHAFLWARA